MSDIPVPPPQELDLSFTYLILQPYPKADKVYLWIDGEKAKKTVKTKLFCDILQQKNPELLGEVQQILNTYSFYMIQSSSSKVVKLTPSGKGDIAYPDAIGAVLQGMPPRNTKKKESKTLMDVIGEYGFSPVSEQDANELRVSVVKKEIDPRQSILSKIMSIGKKK